MAAYIDLNAVRAGIVTDPQAYRYCGYGEAVAGVRVARDGMILGSRQFVDEMFSRHRGNFGVKRQTGARAMCGAQWKGLFTARKLQRLPIIPASVC